MALLEGLLGGADMVQRFGQQQYQNKLATDRLDEQKRQYDKSFEEQKLQSDRTYDEGVRRYNETADENLRQFNIADGYNDKQNLRNQKVEDRAAAEASREQVTRDNDEYVNLLNVAGYISPDGLSLNWQMINDDIAKGPNSDRFGTAEQIVLGFATKFGDLKGSKATAVEALEGGGYGITVTNADGSKGAVTMDATSDPNSPIVRFKPGQLGRLANVQFQSEVLTNTSKFKPTIMRGNMNIIKADADQQALTDKESDFAEDQAYIKLVVAKAEATGDAGLVRQVHAAIAEGGTAVAELIGNDFNIPRSTKRKSGAADSTNTDTNTNTNTNTDTDTDTDATTSVQVATMWSMDSVDRDTKGGQLIASIEGVAKRGGQQVHGERNNTPEKQTEKLLARKAELERTVSTAETLRARSPNRKIDPTKDGLPKNKAELAQINAYIDKDKVSVFTEEVKRSLGDQVKGKSGAQIEEGVNNGTIVVPRELRQLVAAQLEREGIREIRDLKRVKGVEAAMARAAIIASSEDVTIRKQAATQMVNILDNDGNSPSMMRKDEIDDTASTKTYRLNRAKYRKSVNDSLNAEFKDANEAAASLIETTSKLFFGENGDEQNFNAETANMLLNGGALNGFMTRMKAVAGNPALEDQYMMGLNASISLAMAALAGEQDGGIVESVSDFFVRGEVTDNNNPIDFDLRRVVANDTKNPTKFYYIDADGNKTDEAIDAKELQGISESVYEIVREQAIANTPKPKGE